jgi:hypothetical protein
MGLFLVWLLILLPGVPAVLLFYPPGRLSLPARAAGAIALGYTFTAGAAFLLAILSLLRPAVLFPILLALTAVLWFLVFRNRRQHARALAVDIRRARWPLLLGLVVLVAIAVVRSTYLDRFPGVTPFRYWVDGMEIADAGQVPASTLHYGDVYPTATSKIVLNTFSAAVDLLLGGDAESGLNALLFVGALGSAVGLWAIGWELGLRYTAPLLAVLTVANRLVLNGELTVDLANYKAEIFGRMVAFCAAPLMLHVLRKGRGRFEALASGAALAAAGATHLVSLIVVLIVVGWYALGQALTRRRFRELFEQGALAAGSFTLLMVLFLVLPPGTVGFEGAREPSSYSLEAAPFDKSLYLFTGQYRPPRQPEGLFFQSPATILKRFVTTALKLKPARGSPAEGVVVGIGVLMLVVGSGVALVMLRWFPAGVRLNGLVGLGLAVTLVGVTLLFSLVYEVWVPATFGGRRLFDYSALPGLLVGLTILEVALLRFGRLRPSALPAVAAALVLVIAALVLPSARARRGSGANVLPLLSWVRANTSCDDRLLTNQRAVGVFRALTGRVALLEGMGPFLRPGMLDSIVDLMLQTRAFYLDPVSNRGFLVEQGVDYVIAAKRIRVGYGIPIARLDPQPLRGVEFLEPVYSSQGFDVYRVRLPRESHHFPDPADFPGFRCLTEAPTGASAALELRPG